MHPTLCDDLLNCDVIVKHFLWANRGPVSMLSICTEAALLSEEGDLFNNLCPLIGIFISKIATIYKWALKIHWFTLMQNMPFCSDL